MRRCLQVAFSNARRLSTGRATVGAVFDIDGVLVRGHAPLPGARDSLLRLQNAGIPYIFLTNGGGVLESAKAAQLSDELDLEVKAEQVIVAHSPAKVLVSKYHDKRVLIMGCKDVLNVAKSYGFTRPLLTDDLAYDDPSRFPFFHFPSRKMEPPVDASDDNRIHAVLILHDPIHWGVDLQIACDVIRGGVPLGSGAGQAIPVYACNPDFVFAGAYPVPRLAAGSFTQTLQYIFHQLTGQELRIQQFGKPLPVTFDFAMDTLMRWKQSIGMGADAFTKVFMVGDNPRADIRGANTAGEPWQSILVETGVFKPSATVKNDPVDPAKFVCMNVDAAVSVICAAAAAQ